MTVKRQFFTEFSKHHFEDSSLVRMGWRPMFLGLVLVSATLSEAALSETGEEDIPHRDFPFTGLGAHIEALTARGLKLGLVYTGELARVSGGAMSGGTYLDNTDLTLEANLETLLGVDDGMLFIQALGNSGGSPSQYAGDLQVVSNIDAPDTWKIYELWYEQTWPSKGLSLKAGLYDFNSEFDVAATSQLFINSSFGIGAEIAQTGENGPSIFPTTSLSLRGQVVFWDHFYLQAAALDGVAGDPNNSHGTRIELGGDDGLLLAGEAGYVYEPTPSDGAFYRKFALGTWRYTSSTEEDAAGLGISPRKNRGFYLLAESDLVNERDDPEQGLSGFLRYGVADDRINQLDSYFGAGLVYTGFLPGRDRDQLGLAIANARISDHFHERMETLGTPIDAAEVTIELTYRAQLTSWLVLQPDYQLVINPGADLALDHARVFMLRFEVSL